MNAIKAKDFLSRLNLDAQTFAKFIQLPEALLQKIKTTLKLINKNFKYSLLINHIDKKSLIKKIELDNTIN